MSAGIKSKLLARQFWRVTVPKGAQHISLMDFVRALTVLQRGTPDEKLALTFKLADLQGQGKVTRENLLTLMTEVQGMCGQLVTHSGRLYATPADFVDTFFAELELGPGADSFTYEQYEHGAYKSLELISTLNLYGGSALPYGEVRQHHPVSSLPDSIII